MSLPDLSEPTKSCGACGNNIPARAGLCSECKSYQNWRRWIPFSSTVLALLTALISVIAATAPQVVAAVETKVSNLNVVLQGDDRSGGLLILIMNTGNRPGGVRSVYAGLTATEEDFVYSGIVDHKVGSTIIQPNQGNLVRVTFDNQELKKFRLNDVKDGTCLFKVRVVEFSGLKKDHEIREICDSLPTVIPLTPAGKKI